MIQFDRRKRVYLHLRKLIALFFLLVFIISSGTNAQAQKTDTTDIFKVPIQLDSFVVRSGFDIDAFIRRVKNDTTFYKAFKSMHLVPYHAVNDIKVYDKGNNVIASQHNKSSQHIHDHCRIVEIKDQLVTGDFFTRSGGYNYYTAELFAYLFFTDTPVCNDNDIMAGALAERGKGQMEKSKYQLKQLMFNPGAKVSGVPLMGDRPSIFDQDEAKKYDFKVVPDIYDGQECLVFRITPKKGYEHKVLYNELTTWFRRSDYSIVARNYSLSYSTLIYDFDVHMKVRTQQRGDKLYPTHIDYDGNWHIFTKKRERVKFAVDIAY